MRIFRKFKLQQICKAVILGLSALLCAALHADDGKRLAVAPFENKSRFRDTRDDKIGDRFADVFISKLMENENCEIVDRGRVENVIMKELADGLSGLVDPSKAAQIGKKLGANYFIFCSIHEASAKTANIPGIPIFSAMATCTVSINVKMVEVQTGKLELSKLESATTRIPIVGGLEGLTSSDYSKAASKAFDKIAIDIWRKVDPTYTAPRSQKQYEVAAVDLEEVFIDIGGGIRHQERTKA